MSRPTGAAVLLVVATAFIALSVGKTLWDASTRKQQATSRQIPKKNHQKEEIVDEIPSNVELDVEKPENIALSTSTTPKITPELLVQYLNEVATTVENMVAQLPELADLVMAEAQAQGQYVPEEQVKAILVERLGQAVRMAEATVAEKLNVNETDIQSVVHEMHSNPMVLAAIQNFQRVIESSPLAEPAEIPSEITPERTLEIMSVALEGVGRAMEEALEIAKRAGMRDIATDAHMWQDIYVQKSTEYSTAIHERFHVTEPILNAAVAKYNTDPSFQARLQILLAKHQENFKRLGL